MVLVIHCRLGMFFGDDEEAPMEVRFNDDDAVVVLCPRCKSIGRDPNACDLCSCKIPTYALHTILKTNGEVIDLTRELNPNYRPYSSERLKKQKIRYHIKNSESHAYNFKQGIIRSNGEKFQCHVFDTTNVNKTHAWNCTEENLKAGMQLTVKSTQLSSGKDEEKISFSIPEFMKDHCTFSLFEGEDSSKKELRKRADSPFMSSHDTTTRKKQLMYTKKAVCTHLTKGCINAFSKVRRTGNLVFRKKSDDNMTFKSLSDWYARQSQYSAVVDLPENKDHDYVFIENENPLNTKNELIRKRKMTDLTSTAVSSDTVKKDNLLNTTDVGQLSPSKNKEKVFSASEFMQHHYKFLRFEGEDNNIKGQRADASFISSPDNVTGEKQLMSIKKAAGTYLTKDCVNAFPKTQRTGNFINNQKKSDEKNDNPLNTKNKLIRKRKMTDLVSTSISSDPVKKNNLVNTTDISQASNSISTNQKETNFNNLDLTKKEARMPSCPSKFKISFDHNEKYLDAKKIFLNSLKKENNAIAKPYSPEEFFEASSSAYYQKQKSLVADNLNSTNNEARIPAWYTKFKPSNSISTDQKLTTSVVANNLNLTKNEARILTCHSKFKNKKVPQLIYPSIHKENLDCLAEGEDLNDLVIEFYLRYLYNEKLTPELQKRTHICDSFLYTRLVEDQGIGIEEICTDIRKNKNTEAAGKKGPLEAWMKGVDLFSKDFILIPMNKKLNSKTNDQKGHWYLIVICNLSKLPRNPVYDVESETEVCNTEIQSEQKSKPCQLTDERPCICFFDSLDDSCELNKDKEEVAKHLRNFLKRLSLSQVRMYNSEKKSYQLRKLKGLKIICPQQTNAHDCGVFLLQFAESFFETPIANFQDERNVKQWFNQEMIAGKRKIIKDIIEERMAKR